MIITMDPVNYEALVGSRSYKVEDADEFFSNLPKPWRAYKAKLLAPVPRFSQKVYFQSEELKMSIGSRGSKIISNALDGNLFSDKSAFYLFEDFMHQPKNLELDDLETMIGISHEVLAKQKPVFFQNNIGLIVSSLDDAILMTDEERMHEQYKANPELWRVVFNEVKASQTRLNVMQENVTFIDNKRHPTVWSRSIDTEIYILTLEVLKKRGLLDNIKVAAEIGYASGSIMHSAKRLFSPERLYGFDINDKAKYCASELFKLHLNNEKEDYVGIADNTKIIFRDGDGYESLLRKAKEGERFDLVMINPPYLPRSGVTKHSDVQDKNENHYEGIKLIRDLIDNFDDYMSEKGELIMILSNHSFVPELKESIMNALKNGLKMEVIMQKAVPLKIDDLSTDLDWQRELMGNDFIPGSNIHKGYSLWQNLYSVRFYK
ncbi:MAG: hypothetical protein AABW92_03000 [Nanoarchaeota archaeon]